MEEKQAIAQLKKGNSDGLETLVQLYQLQALRTVSLITGDTAQAEDIVENAFIRASERISQFDEQRPFGPWFMRSVIHDALKYLQRRKRSTSLDEMEEQGSFDLFDPAPLPEEAMESKELCQTVWQTLQNLSPRQRAAVVMRYYLDMPEVEIASLLHGPPGTIKWWLYTARQQLKKWLTPIDEAEQPQSAHLPESGDQK